MQRLLATAVSLLLPITIASAQGSQPTTKGAEKKVNRDPSAAQLITSDIHNFWRAFDAATPQDNLNVFKREYLDKGSIGLKDFSKARFPTVCQLVPVVEKNRDHYAAARARTLKVESMKGPIRSSFGKLKELYPDAVFPDVYFMIGANNTGGTTSDNGLLIGVEVYDKLEAIPHVVAHELIHYQQKYPDYDLLGFAIMEGSADFLGGLISGGFNNAHLHAYGDAHERELWLAFKNDFRSKDWGVWFYDPEKAKARGIPKDMGYYIGYQITEAYYNQAQDKKQAVKDILEIKDFGQFLRASKYEEKFGG